MAKHVTKGGSYAEVFQTGAGWTYIVKGDEQDRRTYPTRDAAVQSYEHHAAKKGKQAGPASEGDLWLASVEFRTSEARGLGRTPEEAVSALIGAWQAACIDYGRGDPALVHESRDEVRLVRLTLGRGYMRGTTDDRWAAEFLTGEDPRFDAAFAAADPRDADEAHPAP